MTNGSNRNCPGCDNPDGNPIGTKNGFEIFVCTECRSLYTSQLPSEDDGENYDEYYTEANLVVPNFIKRRVEEIIGGFEGFRETNRLLDVGFGSGIVLEVAKKLGWEVFGQEVSAPAVEKAKINGFEVFQGELSNAGFPSDYFDVITCSEIIEHVASPQVLLNEVSRILRPGGMFWATTPSARGISFRLLGKAWSVLSPPEHTQLYSNKGMSQMLGRAGFSDVSIKTSGVNPNEIFHYYRSRNKSEQEDDEEQFNRVETSYRINEKLSSSPFRQRIKGTLNALLNLFGIGDSLKIYARR